MLELKTLSYQILAHFTVRPPFNSYLLMSWYAWLIQSGAR